MSKGIGLGMDLVSVKSRCKKDLFISYTELELLTEGKGAQVLKKLKVSVMF